MYIKGGERERERVSKWNLLPPCKEWRASLIYALAGLWSPAGVWAAGSKEKEKKKKDQKHSNLYLDINSWIFFFFFSGRSVCNERCHGAEIHRQHIQCFLLYSVEREREEGVSCLVVVNKLIGEEDPFNSMMAAAAAAKLQVGRRMENRVSAEVEKEKTPNSPTLFWERGDGNNMQSGL